MSADQAVKTRKFPKQGTIGHIVLTRMIKEPDPNFEDLKKVVLAKFPDSKFNPAHLAWYKHQVRKGAYQLPDADAGDIAEKGKAKAKDKVKKQSKPQDVTVSNRAAKRSKK